MTDTAKFKLMQRTLLAGEEDLQKDFISKFSDDSKESFRAIFEDWNLPINNSYSPPPTQWSEGQFKKFPWTDLLHEWADGLKVFQYHELALPDTWFGIHIQLVEAGVLKRSFFAHERRSHKTGSEIIRNALKSRKPAERRKKGSKEGEDDPIDRCVRSILRHMGGIVLRYWRSALDCPTSAMFWRMLVLNEIQRIHKKERLADKEIYTNLCEGFAWSTLIETAVEEKTAALESHMRAALFVQVMRMNKELRKLDHPQRSKLVGATIRNICLKYLCQHIGYLNPEGQLEAIKNCVPRLSNE